MPPEKGVLALWIRRKLHVKIARTEGWDVIVSAKITSNGKRSMSAGERSLKSSAEKTN